MLWADVRLGLRAPYSHTQRIRLSTSLAKPMLPLPPPMLFLNLPPLLILLLIIPSRLTCPTPLLPNRF